MDLRDLLRTQPIIAAHLKKDFAAFCRSAWPHLHRGAKLSWTPAHDLICDYLVAVQQKKVNRLIVNCPPRFAKSTIVTILFPIWCWLQDPTTAFLACSYEIDLATNHNLDRRRLMDSKWFRDLFADCFTLATDRSQAGEFSNTSGGVMQAASTNSKAQGRGGDIIIVDDPLSADAATSETFRNETNSWFVHQLPQRLNNPSVSAIVVVMQRLHENDPTGFLLSQEESDWTLLKLPLVAEEEETWTFPVSGRIWKRSKGECLDPKRWSAKIIRQRQQNRLVWSGQFQQSPAPAEGNMIRVDEILYFGGRDPVTGAVDPALPESFERKIISVDASFKDLSSSDYVVVIVVGIVGSRRYLLHVTNAHLDLTGTENEIRNCLAQFGPISATLIEDRANGSSVIAHLKDEIPGVIAIDPQGGKMARVVAASPEFQARNWIIERNGPWTHKVVEQLTMFPNAKYDDITDAVTQASVWLQANTYALGLLDYFKQVATGAKKLIAGVQDRLRRKPGAPTLANTPQARVEGNKGIRPDPDPCPLCKGRGIWISHGIGRIVAHCNQCGADDGKLLDTATSCDCGNFLAQMNGTRCGNCGWQKAAPGIVGMTFAQYNKRSKRFE